MRSGFDPMRTFARASNLVPSFVDNRDPVSRKYCPINFEMRDYGRRKSASIQLSAKPGESQFYEVK